MTTQQQIERAYATYLAGRKACDFGGSRSIARRRFARTVGDNPDALALWDAGWSDCQHSLPLHSSLTVDHQTGEVTVTTTVAVTTKYETHPGSNVGAIRARGYGRSCKVRIDQANNATMNHREAAAKLMARLHGADVDFSTLTETGSNDAGTHRTWTATVR